jgi:hypothetical protein
MFRCDRRDNSFGLLRVAYVERVEFCVGAFSL